ncbi:MAG: DUF1343 domain-containing protein, partial [Halobacteriovoraceae bacterium]|nr:DUF1343 domain-containing protein [Halobacteriovoraceae bacterium]
MGILQTGLENLIESGSAAQFKGQIGLLCHSASTTRNFELAAISFKKLFGNRFCKLFGPQHGFVCDVQDNMIETKSVHHPYFDLPVYSLYSETRVPSDEMLEGLDTLFVDLQDVGTRIYTYISTLKLLMEACGKKGIKVVVLDRPNPVGGLEVEGNILKPEFKSFVGQFEIPMRHGMTMGEVGLYALAHEGVTCEYQVFPMKGWSRSMLWSDTGLSWINPSPNLPTPEGCLCFPGTVIFEGTTASEGRGTTRSLELVGAPDIEPFSFVEQLNSELKHWPLQGFILRPLTFHPTFQKFANQTCGGVHIQITDPQVFKPWALGQFLCAYFKKNVASFDWNTAPYEYENDRLSFDLLNGDDQVRKWVEKDGSYNGLKK